MLQQTFLPIPGAEKLSWKAIGRFFSLVFLRPLQQCLEIIFYGFGIGFLVRFGLEFYPSAVLESLWLVVRIRYLTDPILAPLRESLGALSWIPKDSFRALPLAVSILIWLIRPPVVSRVKRLRVRLEGTGADSLFAPRHLLEVEGESEWALEPAGEEPPAASNSPPAAGGRPSSIVSSANGEVQLIGRYELLEELGRGPAGAVYKALDLQIGRTVALKVILPHGRSPEQLRQEKERVYREARTAGKLMHPGIVTVLDVAQDSLGNPYIVMEFVEGERLDQALSQKSAGEPPTLAQRLDIAVQIAKTLDYAHRRGVVHRDIKPSNILMTPEGNAKVADFGIAKVMEPQVSESGAVPGTPAFVSPELVNGAGASARSDIFSLGVVLYWMFTGEIPFTGETVTEIVHQVSHANPIPARRLNWALPEELDQVLRRCLAKNPAARYPSAGELATDLAALRDGRLRKVSRRMGLASRSGGALCSPMHS